MQAGRSTTRRSVSLIHCRRACNFACRTFLGHVIGAALPTQARLTAVLRPVPASALVFTERGSA